MVERHMSSERERDAMLFFMQGAQICILRHHAHCTAFEETVPLGMQLLNNLDS